MAMEEQSDQQQESNPIEPFVSQEIVPADVKEPTTPEGISQEEARDIQSRAADLVRQLADASGSREMELIDSAGTVGMQAFRNGGSGLDLLRTRVGEMLNSDRAGSNIAKDMVDLRLALNEINPSEFTKQSIVTRVFSKVPILGNFTPALRALERIAIRYEPVSRQVTVIESRLREGRMMITRDNVELRKLYEQVEAQQLPIQKNIYLGEVLMEELTNLIERTDDPQKAERLRSALHAVTVRVQDLRTMEAVHGQFFVSIEMTRENNTRLGQSVERTLVLATNVVTVGLAIQVALSRQQRVLEATQRTREFLGEMIAANASAIKQQTEAIGDVYNNPVVAIEKIAQAHQDLIEAMDLADRLKQEGIETARENIAKLGQMSNQLEQRFRGVLTPPADEPRSLEA